MSKQHDKKDSPKSDPPKKIPFEKDKGPDVNKGHKTDPDKPIRPNQEK